LPRLGPAFIEIGSSALNLSPDNDNNDNDDGNDDDNDDNDDNNNDDDDDETSKEFNGKTSRPLRIEIIRY